VKVLKAFWQPFIIPTKGYKIPYQPKHNYVIDNDIVIVPKESVMSIKLLSTEIEKGTI